MTWPTFERGRKLGLQMGEDRTANGQPVSVQTRIDWIAQYRTEAKEQAGSENVRFLEGVVAGMQEAMGLLENS